MDLQEIRQAVEEAGSPWQVREDDDGPSVEELRRRLGYRRDETLLLELRAQPEPDLERL